MLPANMLCEPVSLSPLRSAAMPLFPYHVAGLHVPWGHGDVDLSHRCRASIGNILASYDTYKLDLAWNKRREEGIQRKECAVDRRASTE